MADAAFCKVHNEIYDYCPVCEADGLRVALTEAQHNEARAVQRIATLEASTVFYPANYAGVDPHTAECAIYTDGPCSCGSISRSLQRTMQAYMDCNAERIKERDAALERIAALEARLVAINELTTACECVPCMRIRKEVKAALAAGRQDDHIA